MTWFVSLVLATTLTIFGLDQVCGEKKVTLNADMLKFNVKLATSIGSTSYAKAVDGEMGQGWTDCANSVKVPTRLVWLTIDLGRLYSVSNVKMLSRAGLGTKSKIYVGKSAIQADGRIGPGKDHKCGTEYPAGRATTSLKDFPCSPVRWIRYVTIHRHGQYLQVCEVEVYYDENTADGVAITTKNHTIRSMGEIASCGSPNGDFGPIWKFPNGTKVLTKMSAAIQQVNDSSSPGYKQLHLQSFVAPNGDYICEYIANNASKTKTVNIVFYCQSTSWSACSVSCGRGKRTRIVAELKGSTCSSIQSSKDCLNTNCGRIDMSNAVATHGPGRTFVGGQTTLAASLAIDGEIRGPYCAATLASTSPWLQVDVKTAYFITRVEASFLWDRGDGAIVRVGSISTDNGNVNPKCGQPISNSASGMWITTVCSPPLWGRYINVQKISTKQSYLSVCELKASYKLEVGILYNDSSIASGSIYSYAGKPLPFPVLCGVNPDPTNFNELLKIRWKSGNLIPALSSNPDIGQSEMSNLTSLHIEKAPSVDKQYSCHFTWTDQTQKSLVFNLNINVDCSWNEWSGCFGQCGVGKRSRTTIASKHRGKSCTGSPAEDCDTGTPCTPTPVKSLVTVQEGKKAMLECETSHYRQVAASVTFEWFKDGVKLPFSSSVRLESGRYRGTLTLTSVNRTDAGSFYTCKARGVRGLSEASTAITLDVTYAPHNVKVKSNFSAFVKEGRVILGCFVEANPIPHQYSWWKDGLLQAGSGSQFVISSSTFSGNDTYKCAAVNSLGSSMSEKFVFSLIPERCTGLSGTSSVGGSISLTISSCLVNGNADVKKYKVLYRFSGSSDVWSAVVIAASPTITVRYLIPFTAYEIKIAAGNEYGYGPNSSTIEVLTSEAEPGPPQSVSAIPLSSYSVFVSWSQPTTPYGIIAKYKIYYGIASSTFKRETTDNEVVAAVSGSETTVILTDLSPATVYVIRVAAVNVRQYDGTFLEGIASGEVSVQTAEAAFCSCSVRKENLCEAPLFNSVTVALTILFVLTLVVFSILLLVCVRQRQTLKRFLSDRNEKNLYEMPSKVGSKFEGDVVPRKMTQSSAYKTVSSKNQKTKDSVDETYAEIGAPKKDTSL